MKSRRLQNLSQEKQKTWKFAFCFRSNRDCDYAMDADDAPEDLAVRASRIGSKVGF